MLAILLSSTEYNWGRGGNNKVGWNFFHKLLRGGWKNKNKKLSLKMSPRL